jgi:Phosphate-selective porin O and P
LRRVALRLAAALALVALPLPLRAADNGAFRMTGYIQMDYRRADPPSGEDSPAHVFDGRRARLTLSGKVSDRVSYRLGLQGDGLDAGSASLLDAVVAVRLAPWARLSAGQFKYDFDMEGRGSASRLALSDRPFVTQALAGGLSGASTPASPAASFRDRGLSLDGAAGFVSYGIGLFQGNGRARDNNSSFAWVARVQAGSGRSWRLSAGVLDSPTADSGAPGPGHFRAWTAGAAWERGSVRLAGEYYGARRETVAGLERASGFYLRGVYAFLRDFEGLLRYQRYEDPRVSDGAVRSLDLGVRFYVVHTETPASLLVNALFRQAPAGPLDGLTLLNDGRGASVARGEDLGPVVVVRLQVDF